MQDKFWINKNEFDKIVIVKEKDRITGTAYDIQHDPDDQIYYSISGIKGDKILVQKD